MAVADAPNLDVSFADPDVLQDPYPVFEEIRAAGAVVYNPSAEAWMVTSYEDVRSILLDDESFLPEAEKWEALYGAPVMESMEEPRHREVRGIWAPSFRVVALRQLQDRITELVDVHLDPVVAAVAGGEEVDVVTALSRPVAAMVLAHMIGVSDSDTPQFLAWAKQMGNTLEAYDEPDPQRRALLLKQGAEATQATCVYAGEQIEQRRRTESAHDLIGELALSPVADTLTEAEERAAVAQLIVAGHDNAAHTLSHVILALGMHPEQRAAIAADRSLVTPAVEEVLRWRTSASGDTRLARKSVSIGSTRLEAGEKVLVLLAAANRDPERWTDPGSFDVHREQKKNLAFGAGIHVCLGISLARIEAQIFMNRLLDRLPDYHLTDERIEYGPPFFMRGPSAVKIGR